MNTIDARRAVGQLVAERPERARVFEKLGLDYCCGGKKPLEEACAVRGLDEREVIHALLACESYTDEETADWMQISLADLADHIVSRHHGFLRRELPRLTYLTAKVATAHSARHPELRQLETLIADFRAEMEQHMLKEEQVLFPICKRMEAAGEPAAFPCGTLRNPILQMEREHEDAAAALTQMRELTGGFTAPPDACATYRVLMNSLAELEWDMHQHVHKENNILFPRALALESTRACPGA